MSLELPDLCGCQNYPASQTIQQTVSAPNTSVIENYQPMSQSSNEISCFTKLKEKFINLELQYQAISVIIAMLVIRKLLS